MFRGDREYENIQEKPKYHPSPFFVLTYHVVCAKSGKERASVSW